MFIIGILAPCSLKFSFLKLAILSLIYENVCNKLQFHLAHAQKEKREAYWGEKMKARK
jgi:hypothetical protein